MTLIPPLGPNRHVRRGVEWSCATSVTLDEGVEPDLRRDSVQPLDDELGAARPRDLPFTTSATACRAGGCGPIDHAVSAYGCRSPPATPSRCDDDKGSSQATRMLGDEVYDIAADLTTGLRRVPEQDNAQARLSLCEHELTEVFILGATCKTPRIRSGCRRLSVAVRMNHTVRCEAGGQMLRQSVCGPHLGWNPETMRPPAGCTDTPVRCLAASRARIRHPAIRGQTRSAQFSMRSNWSTVSATIPNIRWHSTLA